MATSLSLAKGRNRPEAGLQVTPPMFNTASDLDFRSAPLSIFGFTQDRYLTENAQQQCLFRLGN